MGLISARRAITACAISAAAASMVVAPSAASAAVQCSGENIKGAGASTQKLMHELLGPQFNTSTNAKACAGTQGSKGTPKLVEYQPEGSGFGLEKYGVNGHAFEAGTFPLVGTDEPPNKAQKEEIENHETTPGSVKETVQSIPIAQVAIAIVVHLPEKCTATSTAAPGRLVLNNVTLEGIYRGTISKWSEITGGGDKLEGAECNAATPIKRIVRLDESGTTHIYKKYLGLINAGEFETETGGKATWVELSEGKPQNTTWPKAAEVEKPVKSGGGAVVAKVAEAPGSIGYAGLADARKNGGFSKTGGPGTDKFWAEIQNNGTSTAKPTYKDPASNGDVEAVANANCAKEKYTNGKGTKFPPATTGALWNEVTTATKEKNYPICGLTYALGLSAFSAYPGTTEGVATTEENYLVWALEKKAGGGQALLLGHDFEPVPAALLKEATNGAKLIKF